MRIPPSRMINPLTDPDGMKAPPVKYVLVENVWDEDISWSPEARYSDHPDSCQPVDYNIRVGKFFRMEDDYAKACFGMWDIREFYADNPDGYPKAYTQMMLRQGDMWPTPSPPHVRIYEEDEQGNPGTLLLDTWEQWDSWIKTHGKTELARKAKKVDDGLPVPVMPEGLAKMDRAALIVFARKIKFRLPENCDWDERTLRDILFREAPMDMVYKAISKTQEEVEKKAARQEAKATTSSD